MGPLHGLRIIEMAGIGPVPLCAMILADLGADIVRIDRPADPAPTTAYRGDTPTYNRGRPSIGLDLKNPEGAATVLAMAAKADAIIEGYRPGVMERLGLGPDKLAALNPRLVYGRMTGWGQDGPLAQAPGHDLNYLAITGALHAIGPADGKPVVPLNLIADFGGGAMFLAVGVLAALLEAKTSSRGQVVDAAMTDGTSVLMTLVYSMLADKGWTDAREANVIDGGAHFYGTYETKDGKYVAIGSLEKPFYAELRKRLALTSPAFDAQMDRSAWPALRTELEVVFKTKTRDEWCAELEGSDVCFAPVLSLAEAPAHPHNVARKTFATVDGRVQPSPAPRFSRTAAKIGRAPSPPGADTEPALRAWGFTDSDLLRLKTAKAT